MMQKLEQLGSSDLNGSSACALEPRFDFQSSGQLRSSRIHKGTCDIKAGLDAMARFAKEKDILGLTRPCTLTVLW